MGHALIVLSDDNGSRESCNVFYATYILIDIPDGKDPGSVLDDAKRVSETINWDEDDLNGYLVALDKAGLNPVVFQLNTPTNGFHRFDPNRLPAAVVITDE